MAQVDEHPANISCTAVTLPRSSAGRPIDQPKVSVSSRWSAGTRRSTSANGARAPQLQAEGDSLEAPDGSPHLGLWWLLVCHLCNTALNYRSGQADTTGSPWHRTASHSTLWGRSALTT